MYSKEFYSYLEYVNKVYYDNKLLLETVHPIDIMSKDDEVLEEAVINVQKIKKVIANMAKFIMEKTDSFYKMTMELIRRNSGIVKKYNQIDINKLKLDDFDYEMCPYWDMINNIEGYRTPAFDLKDANLINANSGIEYKLTKFPQGLFDKENDYNVNTEYFTGPKKHIDKSNARQAFEGCKTIIAKRQNLVSKTTNENKQIAQVLTNSINMKAPVTESVLFNKSIFKDEYIDILFEDIVTTTADIKKEEKDEQKGIPQNKDENEKYKNAEHAVDTAKKYSEICYGVNSKIMSVLDESYDQAIKFCEKISKL